MKIVQSTPLGRVKNLGFNSYQMRLGCGKMGGGKRRKEKAKRRKKEGEKEENRKKNEKERVFHGHIPSPVGRAERHQSYPCMEPVRYIVSHHTMSYRIIPYRIVSYC